MSSLSDKLQKIVNLEHLSRDGYNIKMDFSEIEWQCVDWISLLKNTDHFWSTVDVAVSRLFFS
jgi:hypothetical protein